MDFEVVLTILLILLNGFFVCAEFSIVKVRSSQLDIKINQGSARAKIAKNIVDNLDKYIAATQTGITLCSLGLGYVGEEVMTGMMSGLIKIFNINLEKETLESIAAPIGFILITMLHIIFGEQMPKMIGIKFSLSASTSVAWPLRIFYFVFGPFIWLLHKLSNGLLRMIGIKTNSDGDVHSEEELRMILTESEEGGAIKPSEHELIQNVFDFDDRFVKQIMIPQGRISAVNVESGRDKIIRQVIDEGYSRLPVYLGDIDNVIGILHSKDLLKAAMESKFNTIRDIMRPVHFVPESMKVTDLLRDFQKLHIGMAIVSNEHGATAGLVTMEDIIEEIVGEIQDEHDEEKPMVEKKSETEFIIKAQSSIVDVNESLPIAIPIDPHYETVSGWVNYVFGRIAAVNETKHFGGYEIKILSRKKQSVEAIQLRVINPENIT
ncbi:MAG: hemolysin family protein [Bacteroidota bacterium]|jgi:CBS domain containing-hemolysin-like protein